MSNKNNDFKPYIAADRIVPEFTVTSIIIGIILAVVFGAANAYLGLRVGMTISASIPAAVLSMGIIRIILRRDSILENNMVQTIGSAGESVAAGAIFTLPALFIWAKEGTISTPSILTLFLVALVGGILGVVFMVPLRQALIVEEHGTLPFPEGTACAEVLLAGEEGGSKAGIVFAGLGISALYKLITDGLKVFPSEIGYDIASYKGSSVGIQVLPALAGVGYICGTKISSYLFAGGVVRWFIDRRKGVSDEERKKSTDRGTLYTSGLIAGEGLMGIILAALAAFKVDIDVSKFFSIGKIGGLIVFVLLLLSLAYVCVGKKKKSAEQ